MDDLVIREGGHKRNPIISWDTEYKVYRSEENEEIQEVVTVEKSDQDNILKKYYSEKYELVFEEWDDGLDSADLYEMLDKIFIRRKRTVNEEKQEGEMEPGFYRVVYVNHEIGLKPVSSIQQDDYIEMNLSVSRLKNDMKTFMKQEDVFNQYNMTHKRNSLLYGPPGTGKTFTIMHICKKMVEEYDAIIILAPAKDTDFKPLTSNFREPLEDYNKIFIIEEITEAKGKKEEILSFLDGEDSWEHSYTIGTTNYPEKLDNNVVDRPGRFDRIIEVGFPDKEERRTYLEELTGREYSDKEIQLTSNYSFAYLKELVLRMEFENKSLREVVEDFNELKRKIDNEFRDEQEIPGF